MSEIFTYKEVPGYEATVYEDGTVDFYSTNLWSVVKGRGRLDEEDLEEIKSIVSELLSDNQENNIGALDRLLGYSEISVDGEKARWAEGTEKHRKIAEYVKQSEVETSVIRDSHINF